MLYAVYLNRAQLKVISGVLINIGSGLLLVLLTSYNPVRLTLSYSLAILCFKVAILIEERLEE